MMMLRRILLVVISSFCLSLSAQEPAYLHYSVSDGLPGTMVYTALEDSNGFIWFGTDKGLARFDGNRFKVYGMKDGMPDMEVVQLFEDSQKRIWISCFGKQPVYIKEDKIIGGAQDSLLKLTEKAGNNSFLEDSKGAIWVSYLSRISSRIIGDKVERYETDSPVRKLMEVDGRMFNLSQLLIEEMMDKNNCEIRFVAPTPFFDAKSLNLFKGQRSSLKDNKWGTKANYVFVSSSKNRVLYGYKEGLLLLEFKDGEFQEIDRREDLPIVNVCTDATGQFWAMLNSGGVLRFNHLVDGLKNPQLYLPKKRVGNVISDRLGNLIFTTLDDGVYILPKDATQTYRAENGSPFFSNNFTAVNVLDDGTLVVGDNVGNLYFREKDGWKSLSDPASRGFSRIRQLLPLPGKNWIAITDKAMFSKEAGNILPEKVIGAFKAICVTKSKVWLGTSHYLIGWNEKFEDPKVALEERTMTIQDDATGNLWVGGLEGLASEKDGFKRKWGKTFPPLASRIIDIEKATNGGLWVATPDAGLLWLDTRDGEVAKVEIINEKLTAPIDNVQFIYVGTDGTVWLATNKGVYSINDKWEINHYDQTNGLANNDVNALVVQEDTLWVATVAGLSKLLLRQKGQVGDFSTFVSGLSYTVDGQKFNYDRGEAQFSGEEIVLPPGTAMLEVNLAALYYRAKGNMRFIYKTHEKLLPLRWVTFDNLLNAAFGKTDTSIVEGYVRNFGANVKAGRFIATVTAILPSGVLSNHPDQVVLTVLPNWWQTIWVYLAAMFAIAVVLWRLLRARDNYMKMQSVNSELQLQAIRAQMNPHFVGNSINAIQQFFYPPDPVKASEYISIFSDLLRRTLYFSERDFISFEEELAYVQDYLKMIQLRFGTRFNYSITGQSAVDAFTPFPAMLLQPLLENATIHGLSPNGLSTLHVHFGFERDRLICSVQDNGVGIEASKARKLAKGGVKRVSKGIALLEKKVKTLNQLYLTDMQLTFKDLSQDGSGLNGTLVVLSFSPSKAKVGQTP